MVLKAPNGEIIAASQGYETKASTEKGIAAVKTHAANAKVEDHKRNLPAWSLLISKTTHSFRKTVATLIDDEGLSARIGADHLGHAQVSMTQDRYMARGRQHAEVAELLDRTVAISDE